MFMRNDFRRAGAWACAGLVIFLGVATNARADSVLIVDSDSTGQPQAELLARGFTTVDRFDANLGVPTLAQLSAYDAVLAYTNFIPADAVGLGNVLADYVDAGGRVTLTTYGYSDPWAIAGRIATAGYSPLVNLGVNGDVSGLLVPTAPLDPIFAGVDAATLTYFHNGNFAQPGLDAGATLLATDGAVSLVARNAAGNVVGLNLFPQTGLGNNGEFYDLLANSLRPSAPVTTPVVPVPAAVWGGMVLLGGLGVTRRFRSRSEQLVNTL